ncbi:deoxyribonuclease-1-like 1 isoform X2 [Gopherus flavomarginatus]|uniref:deoxyribonuclease-1-like 1 isoform X2 n=1 Tax=Gopherus flavomarginatus TaxID=286002 RepID=UPI0021CC48F0|nr:deoxyribonuclease-1-like 1 isoform X2 [Gopherus flavomarginatus]XP_050783316.1 deoxyribonuclease-1-like 1 isoform X2 [Gopherus flavomarginatus]
MGLPLRTLLLLLLLCPAGAPFRICAFNLQRFASPKAATAAVMDTLVKIVSRCDIAVLQEVMDAKGQAVPALISALHRSAGPDSYTALGSPLLGARNYQERYVFVYRSGRTQVLDSYVYLDENPDRPDAFAREPFVVHFSLPSKVLPTLVLVPQHTVPKKAEAEIDALYDVFLDVQARWGTEDIMFLGDFNADCGYVAKKRWGQIQLRREPGFHWLIGDTADTTVRNSTRCAYDRIVVHGERCLGLVVPGSAQPFDFPAMFGLTKTEALKVSDHYPVEVLLELNAAPRGHCPAGPALLPLAMLLARLGGWL